MKRQTFWDLLTSSDDPVTFRQVLDDLIPVNVKQAIVKEFKKRRQVRKRRETKIRKEDTPITGGWI